jgi:hypothetical protein
MVLVDPAHESGRYGYRGELVQVRTLASDRPVPEPAALHERPPQFATGDAAQRCRSVAASATVFGPYLKLPSREQQSLLWLLRNPKCYVTGDDYLPEEFASMHEKRLQTPYPLESMPLVVIARMRSSPPPGVDRNEWEREKLAHKHDLATLSMQGRVVTDSLSGHHIHIDNPGLVVNTIRDMVRRVRGH